MDVNLKRWLAGLTRYILGCAIQITLSETTRCTDSSADEEKSKLATQTEIDEPSDRNWFKKLSPKTVGFALNIPNSQFGITFKNVRRKRELPKARLVPQAHQDLDTPYLIYESTTLNHSSLRIIILFAATAGCSNLTKLLDLAYIQSEELLSTSLFFGTPKQLRSLKHLLWKLIHRSTDWQIRETTGKNFQKPSSKRATTIIYLYWQISFCF